MDILYLGGLCSTSCFDKLIKKEPNLSQAAYKYEYQFIDNLKECIDPNRDTLEIISSLPYELGKEEQTQFLGLKTTYVYGAHRSIALFLNSMLKVYYAIKKWRTQKLDGQKVIITYAVEPTLVLPALIIRLFKPKVKIITICSEVPALRNYEHMSKIRKLSVKFLFEFINESMDGYIFFSKHMNKVCNRKNKPWIVVEGLPTISETTDNEHISVTSYKETIMYAGGLDTGYGVEELIEGFRLIPRTDIRLVICGNGMLQETIEALSKKDARISYLGMVQNSKVVEIEQGCSILINPRKPDLELTKYSFPSKTIEYMSNGRAVTLITRLDGIPDEYYQYCYTIEKITPQAIANSIQNVLNESSEKRSKMAKDARAFIIREKSAACQVAKMLQFTKRVLEEGL